MVNSSRIEAFLGLISVQVTDTGVGLSPESLAVVGEEYVQNNAHDLQSGRGSGLGLWISKNIVVLHNDTMAVDSDGVGYGTTVTIVLPVYTGDAIIDQSVTPHRDSVSVILYRKIIVVDDASSARKLVVRLLTRTGYKCIEAVNGQNCLDVIAKHDDIDMVLMDYEMPVMNGPDATQIISKQWGQKLPVVGLTGNALPQDLAYFRKQGAVDVLVKPLNLSKLTAFGRYCSACKPIFA